VSVFVLNPEIEDRGEVEVGNWTKIEISEDKSFFFLAIDSCPLT
jgi:hypothetical protein